MYVYSRSSEGTGEISKGRAVHFSVLNSEGLVAIKGGFVHLLDESLLQKQPAAAAAAAAAGGQPVTLSKM